MEIRCSSLQEFKLHALASKNTEAVCKHQQTQKKRVAGEETGEYRDKEEDIPHVPVT